MKKFLLAAPLAVVSLAAAHSQAISVNGGAIQGTITDPSGAAVPNADITITSLGEGSARHLQTDTAGYYSIGPLNPGEYKVTIVASGFERLEVTTRILTGTATPGSFKLPVGRASETVEVSTGDVQVNTDQAGVSDVITKEQIDSLPVNGRNFLDLAQIEPGVVLQQGSSFDPTKTGYTGISVNGVSGRTTRIILDGQDITDEFVGTTIVNVSQGSVNEFQLNRSTQDVSGEVTSQGQVLVATRSGTNTIHGQAFYFFQDQRGLFANPNGTGAKLPPVFQRNHFGGSIGGPIIKDKLFLFANSERLQQKAGAPNQLGTVFANSAFSIAHPTISSPFHDTYSAARLDENGPFGGHYFARGYYEVNSAVNAGGSSNYAAFANRDNTYGLAFGADFAKGKFTHSFRGSYEKFHNLIGDASAASGYDPLPGGNGLPPVAIRYSLQNLYVGPNANAPQGTFQSDKQIRYDGGYTAGTNTVRFGGAFNRIQSGGFANFYGIGPRINLSQSNLLAGTATTANPAGLGCKGVPGATSCPDDPVNGYNISSFTFGNGLGGFSEFPAFGLPFGGFNAYRFSFYVADSWKITPSFTLTGGVRYSADTNRENNDLNLPTCADLSTVAISGASAAPSSICTGLASTTKLFSLFNPSYANAKVKQPFSNFGPQLGMVYAPGNHKTVLRAGFGIFYESVVFNNTSNSRSNLEKSGAYYASINPCNSTYRVIFPDGTPKTTTSDGTSLQSLCQTGTPGSSYAKLAQFYKDYQASAAANALSANNAYVGTSLNASGLYGPNYKTPYSEQWNFGLQRELFKGGVISADYVHNTTLKIGQTIDQNRLGAARTYNNANAILAINATATGNYGGACVSASQAAEVACLISRGASIGTFASKGLDSAAGFSSSKGYLANGNAYPATFPGLNQNVGSGAFIAPTGRSGYDALQIVFHQSKAHPAPGIERGNIQVSYNLSRIVSNLSSSDQFFSSGVYDNDNPNQFIGRNGLDRKHELSFGGSFTVKYGLQVGLIGHFFSALPTNLTLDTGSLTSGGNIFQSDITGDGTTGDIAPGTLPGDYMHRIKNTGVQTYINNYNATYAGKATPAGQALINSGNFTLSQLTALRAVIQPLANAPVNIAPNNPMFRSMDANVSYPIRMNFIREGLSLEPAIAFYNVGNFSNFGSLTGVLNNITTGTAAPGAVTGDNSFATQANRRTQRGTGTFDQGAPRSAEFQLKLNF